MRQQELRQHRINVYLSIQFTINKFRKLDKNQIKHFAFCSFTRCCSICLIERLREKNAVKLNLYFKFKKSIRVWQHIRMRQGVKVSISILSCWWYDFMHTELLRIKSTNTSPTHTGRNSQARNSSYLVLILRHQLKLGVVAAVARGVNKKIKTGVFLVYPHLPQSTKCNQMNKFNNILRCLCVIMYEQEYQEKLYGWNWL